MLLQNILPRALYLILGLGILSCKKENNPPAPTNTSSALSSFTVASHPQDPLFGIAKFENGNQVHIFGMRDSIGTPLMVNALMSVINKDTTWIHTNQDGKINFIKAQNGCEISIDWLENGLAVVTAKPNDSTELQSEFSYSMRPGKGGIQQGNRMARPLSTTETQDLYACNVSLTKCGSPSGIFHPINVIAQELNGTNLGTFPATSVGGGQYKAMIPGGLAPTIDLKKLCESLNSVLEVACEIMGFPQLDLYLCGSLSAAATASGIAAPATGLIFSACLAATNTFENFCIAGNSSGLLSKFCDSDFIDRGIRYDMALFAITEGHGVNIASSKVIVPNGYQSLPDLTIGLPAKTSIEKSTIIPARPGYRTPFTMKCRVICPPAGGIIKTNVKMGVNMVNPYEFDNYYNVDPAGAAYMDIEIPLFQKFSNGCCLDVNITTSGHGQVPFAYHLHRDI